MPESSRERDRGTANGTGDGYGSNSVERMAPSAFRRCPCSIEDASPGTPRGPWPCSCAASRSIPLDMRPPDSHVVGRLAARVPRRVAHVSDRLLSIALCEKFRARILALDVLDEVANVGFARCFEDEASVQWPATVVRTVVPA